MGSAMDSDEEDIIVRLAKADDPTVLVRLESADLPVREEDSDLFVPPGIG